MHHDGDTTGRKNRAENRQELSRRSDSRNRLRRGNRAASGLPNVRKRARHADALLCDGKCGNRGGRGACRLRRPVLFFKIREDKAGRFRFGDRFGRFRLAISDRVDRAVRGRAHGLPYTDLARVVRERFLNRFVFRHRPRLVRPRSARE